MANGTTALIAVNTKFLTEHPDLVRKWLTAHVELTQRINADPTKAKTTLNSELKKLTGQALAEGVLDDAWGRQTVTYDPVSSSLYSSADAAFKLGYLGDTAPHLDGIYDLSILNGILKDKNLSPVQ